MLPVMAQTVEDKDSDTLSPEATESKPSSHKTDLKKASEGVISRINLYREKEGLKTVSSSESLTAAARYFANYMAEKEVYGHRADGQRPSQRAENHGYDYCIVSENIAYIARREEVSAEDLAQEFTQSWLDSEGHRKNIVDPVVTETGVAIAQSKSGGRYFAVQMFGRPIGNQIDFRFVNDSPETLTYILDSGGNQRSLKLPTRMSRTHKVCRPTSFRFEWMGNDRQAERGETYHITGSGEELQIE